MALQTCKCINSSCSEYNIQKEMVLKSGEIPYCKVCQSPLSILFPCFLHVKTNNKEVDGRDRGKVTQEKNEALKKKHSGYSYEEQNLRTKMTKMADKIIKDKEAKGL
jgi:hypothetical protein